MKKKEKGRKAELRAYLFLFLKKISDSEEKKNRLIRIASESSFQKSYFFQLLK